MGVVGQSVLNTLVRKGYNRVVVPSAQVKTLFSIPVILVPAFPGFHPLMHYVNYNMAAHSVAYVLNGNTNLVIRSIKADGTFNTAQQNLALAGFIDTTAATFGSTRHGSTTGVTQASNMIGGWVDMKLDTADMVTGDGTLEVEVIYDLIPSRFGYTG